MKTFHTQLIIKLLCKINRKTKKHYIPSQLVFGWDAVISQRHNVEWEIKRKQKQDFTNKGNKCENSKWRNHMYKQGDKILLKNTWKTKFNQDAYLGPYVIKVVRKNHAVRACKGRVMDIFNIQNQTPHKE